MESIQGAFASLSCAGERLTVIGALHREDLQPKGATTVGLHDGRSSLRAACVACGATAYDWRRLLGIGAKVVSGSADGGRIVVIYPGACGKCGASELVVSAMAQAA